MTSNSPAVTDIERVIGAHLAEWDAAHVELAIYGVSEPATIARAIGEFCYRELRGVVAGAYRSSVGAVAGLELDDGRRVVVNAHQPDWTRARLEEIVRLQTHLAARGLFAPAVLTGPAPLGRGLAVVEEYIDRGATANAHRPEIRRALAGTLRAVVEALEPFVAASPLPPQGPWAPLIDGLWPTPHSRLFDFEATRAGAEDIDDSAERRLFGGAFAYSVAYSARCWHALGHDDRRKPGNFQHLVATYGHGLLAL